MLRRMERLDGTVALVTGASSGIGEATARELAQRGAAVAIAARRKERLDALAAEIEGAGGSALAVEADVTDAEQVKRLVADTVERFGRLDTVINNAGVMLLGPIVDAPVEEWDRMITLNLQGLLYVAHEALPHLLDAAQLRAAPRRRPREHQLRGGPRRTQELRRLQPHQARRGAFSESLRQEVTGRHVRVSLVEPGAVITELPDHVRAEIRDQMMGRLTEIERLESEDIADAIAYIVSRPRRVAINELLIRPTEQEQ